MAEIDVTIDFFTEVLLFLIIINTYVRHNGWNVHTFYVTGPLVVLCHLGFSYGFTHSPKGQFLLTWMLGSGINYLFALIAGLLLFDKTYTITQGGGYVLMLLGLFLLAK